MSFSILGNGKAFPCVSETWSWSLAGANVCSGRSTVSHAVLLLGPGLCFLGSQLCSSFGKGFIFSSAFLSVFYNQVSSLHKHTCSSFD